MKRYLVLEDGTTYEGEAFGSDEKHVAEVVFNTGMSGYQEVISDLSYCGQIVTMTYPLVGNYGINRDDFESLQPALSGFIVHECCDYPSNFRCEMSLDEFLKMKKIPGISGIDTRSLTKKLRDFGTMKGTMCDEGEDISKVLEQLKQTKLATDQVQKVSTTKSFQVPARGNKVVLLDFGAKNGIIRELAERGCNIIIVPYHTTAKEILALKPDGVMLSNGPGDPKDVTIAIETIKELLPQIPIFGICLGHQLLALACGANTVKLKFGHRGCNHPVKDLRSNKVGITSQNHGYAVEPESLKETDLEVTHVALNDGTVEGVRHKVYSAFSVQYHPEASPGPEDANELFDEFMKMMQENI